MRADRLLSLIMLLQVNGRMTAEQLAKELEVSGRTIYRDINALSAIGVPIYAEGGPGGGCELLDSYRTNLTGLTKDEVRALFMLSIPAPLAELGVSKELKSALLKLSAALPAYHRTDEVRSRQRVHLDSVEWNQDNKPAPYLRIIQEAVWQDCKLHLTVRSFFDAQLAHVVNPYGLVAKANVWYLVGARDDHIRVYRVDAVLDAYIIDERFEHPSDFDLAAYWRAWCVEEETNRPSFPVTVRIAPDLIPSLTHHFGSQVQQLIALASPPDDAGWVTITLPFERLEDARARILGFGRAIEVLEPETLRRSVLDFAHQIVSLYTLDFNTRHYMNIVYEEE
ncbi:MAG: YafY family transcriptional regulator [Chloroflexi bacterium]|nr:YafY family transcriptional regulator [Chloroflexota bacterium]